MNTKIELITPQKALNLLKNNTKNRKLRQDLVLFYAEQMKKGQWKLTGQGISFADDGTLIDGQHRLAAIVKSGIEQRINVTYGLNYNDVYSTYDTGKNRTSSDLLSIDNVKHATAISSGIRIKIKIDKNKNMRGSSITSKISNIDIKSEFDNNKEFYKKMVNIARKYTNIYKILSTSLILGIMAHLILTKKNEEKKVFDFFNQLFNVDETFNNTISLLRNKLINNLANMAKINSNTKILYIKKTWNAYITGNEYMKLNLVERDKNINFI